MPRPPLQETQHKPTQIPQEEACYQNQTLTMADLSHIRQQGTLLVDHRGIVLPDARKWTTASESTVSKAAQTSSPFQALSSA